MFSPDFRSPFCADFPNLVRIWPGTHPGFEIVFFGFPNQEIAIGARKLTVEVEDSAIKNKRSVCVLVPCHSILPSLDAPRKIGRWKVQKKKWKSLRMGARNQAKT